MLEKEAGGGRSLEMGERPVWKETAKRVGQPGLGPGICRFRGSEDAERLWTAGLWREEPLLPNPMAAGSCVCPAQ